MNLTIQISSADSACRKGWLRVVPALLILLLPAIAPAQEMEVGLAGGGTYYIGDLNPSIPFRKIKPSYGALVRYNIDSRWAVRAALMMGSVAADAADATPFIKTLGLNFKSNITDVSAVAEFNFFPYYPGSDFNKLTPYIYAGISVFFFKPFNTEGQDLRSLGTEGQNTTEGRKPYSKTSFSVPFGLGLKWALTEKLGLQVYWEMHKTFTDYLDDVSTTFYLYDGRFIDERRATPAEAEQAAASDPLASHQPGQQRGDPATNDWFSFFGVSFTYSFKLPGSNRCKELKY